jgi:hypothetical protein
MPACHFAGMLALFRDVKVDLSLPALRPRSDNIRFKQGNNNLMCIYLPAFGLAGMPACQLFHVETI